MNPHLVLSEVLLPSRHGSLPGGQSQGEGEAGGAAPQVQEKDQQVRQLGSLYTRTGTVLCYVQVYLKEKSLRELEEKNKTLSENPGLLQLYKVHSTHLK